jgi:SAM-dependent methyltransferase
MSSEFDPYAHNYSGVLAQALGTRAEDTDRFAAYKIAEVAHVLNGAKVERVLDFGCGVGRSLRFLRHAFPNAALFGFDPSEECVIEASASNPDATLTALWPAIKDIPFDCVFVANVFHHIPLAQRASELARCGEVLGPGGSLFVFEHNPYNPATRWVFDRCPFDSDAAMIKRTDMIELGQGVGLQVRRKAYTLFLPFQGDGWLTLQRPLSWLPLGAQYYVQFTR